MTPGTTISHYRVTGELGRGGMGVVYKAEDTKLDRTVALKLLPPHALVSEDDKARFYREARAAAALNHPNIAHVYEIDEAEVTPGDVRPFIAMEYIDGETIADRITKGQIPLKDVIAYASQMAEGLKAAHRKDVVHRDVKSGNMMLTSAGTIKILDFGLAKTAASTKLTQMGSTLGTVAYMSPEQARGEEVDRRSDIWSLGVILYEMITGVLPFRGDYEQAVVYGILNEDPDSLTNLRAGVPMALDGVIGKMLSKDPDIRYQNVDELPADLKAIDLGSAITSSRISTGSRSVIAAAPAAAATHVIEMVPSQERKKAWYANPVLIGVAALVLGAAIGLVADRMLSGDAEQVGALMRFEVDLPNAINQMLPSWSPDGSELYYLARTGDDNPVHVRRYTLATGESDAVPGTENAADVEVSADGRWLVVLDGPRQQYRRALRSGGAFTDIPGAESPAEWGIYGSDERFYFSTRNWEIGSTGEDGGVIVHTQRDTSVQYLAVPLPAEEGNTVFFSDWTSRTNTVGTYRLVDHSPGFERVSSQYTFLQVLSNGYALVIPSGSTNQPAALAPIDPENGTLQGPAVPIARLEVFGFAFSRTGHLVYREQRSDASVEAEPLFRLVGEEEPVMISGTPGVSDDFATARIRNAVAIEADPDNPDGTDIYVINLDSGVQTRMTRGGDNQYAEWSPDDQYVYYRRISNDSPRGVIMRRRADASEPAELVLANESGSGGGVYHPAVTSDGSHLLFTHDGEESVSQLYRVSLENTLPLDLDEAERLSESSESVIGPDPSPDGRYVVYRAGQSVLVSSIDGQGEVEITSDGSEPIWSPGGAWIYFMRSTDREIYRVAVTTEPVFSLLGSVERVFIVPSHLHYDIAPDGTMLLTMPEGGRQDPGSKIRVVLNLASEAERIAPRSK